MSDLQFYIKKTGFVGTILNVGFLSIILYRFGRKLYVLGFRFINPLWYIYLILKTILQMLSNIELPPTVTIGKRLYLPHPYGLVMGNKVTIGDNCTLGPWIVLGHNGVYQEQPILGNNVYVGAHACILGKVKISDNVLIGANSVVTFDVESNYIVKTRPELKQKHVKQ